MIWSWEPKNTGHVWSLCIRRVCICNCISAVEMRLTQTLGEKQTGTGVCTELVCLHRSPLENPHLRAETPSFAFNRSNM